MSSARVSSVTRFFDRSTVQVREGEREARGALGVGGEPAAQVGRERGLVRAEVLPGGRGGGVDGLRGHGVPSLTACGRPTGAAGGGCAGAARRRSRRRLGPPYCAATPPHRRARLARHVAHPHRRLIAALTLVVGFAVAEVTDVRALGGLVLVAGVPGACPRAVARGWWRAGRRGRGRGRLLHRRAPARAAPRRVAVGASGGRGARRGRPWRWWTGALPWRPLTR